MSTAASSDAGDFGSALVLVGTRPELIAISQPGILSTMLSSYSHDLVEVSLPFQTWYQHSGNSTNYNLLLVFSSPSAATLSYAAIRNYLDSNGLYTSSVNRIQVFRKPNKKQTEGQGICHRAHGKTLHVKMLAQEEGCLDDVLSASNELRASVTEGQALVTETLDLTLALNGALSQSDVPSQCTAKESLLADIHDAIAKGQDLLRLKNKMHRTQIKVMNSSDSSTTSRLLELSNERKAFAGAVAAFREERIALDARLYASSSAANSHFVAVGSNESSQSGSDVSADISL